MLGSGEVRPGRPLYGPTMERGSLIEAAGHARIHELAERSRMTTDQEAGPKAAVRAVWALGDYHRFAKETVWATGEVLVRACGVTKGQRVLDVAAGTGNTAI